MLQPWFEDAKLGIFIHYGIYSVNGVSESWYFRGNPMTKYKPYMAQIKDFKAENYNPEHWGELFSEAGARYAVLTTKHHDGVALFDTKYSDLSVVKSAPCGRDLVAPYVNALRENGLRVGLYFTQCDWSHPEYTAKSWHPFKYFLDKISGEKHWKSFKKFHRNQLTEILKNYGDIDLLWFDGDWERSQADWDMKGLKQWLTELSPKTVINSRIGSYGDYATPEQQMPTVRPDGPWEYCMTINDSWGYQPQDNHFKSPEQIVRIFSNVVCMGGNLLLDVGPKGDGTILPEQEDILRKLGEFTHANEKAIWGTKGITCNAFAGGTTISEDKKSLYCYQYGKPSGKIPVFIPEKYIDKISAVSTGEVLDIERDGNQAWLTLPDNAFIHKTAVFEVKLNCEYDEKAFEKEEADGDYDLSQLLQLYLNAKMNGKEFVMPNVSIDVEAEFNAFVNKHNEAFACTKAGLGRNWFCGYSLLSNDEKTLYVFSFEGADTPLYINGVNNKKKTVTILPENKTLATDNSVGLGAGPGTLWLKLSESEIHEPCTVIKISFDKKIELYSGTGAPITQN